MNLYDLNAMYSEALQGAIDENGEIQSDVLAELLGEIAEAKETKVLNIACFIKNLLSNADAINLESERLKARRDALKRKADGLQRYLENSLSPGEKFADSRAEISWRKSSAVNVSTDADMLAKIRPDLVRTKYEPDKTAIKKAIEGGDLIVGCEIVNKQNMVIK